MIEPLRRLPPSLRYGLAVACVALAAGGFASVFRRLLAVVFARIFHAPDVVEAIRGLPPAMRLLLPALGGLVAGLLGVVAARGQGGRGIADVMEAVALGRTRISLWAILVKAAASFAAIVGGGSVGREGPLIQFGGASGSTMGALFGVEETRARALVAAGAAAGFAAAYNTPIAGVMFVLEIVTGLIAFPLVVPVVLATVFATALARATVGGGPLYGLRSFALLAPAELLAYAAVGCGAGLVGVAFMLALRRGEGAFARLPLPRPLRAAAGGLIVGVIALGLPEIGGNGYEVIQWTLDGRYAAGMLAVLLAAKAVATVASVSSGSPGGVFTPSMFLGAALGGLLGHAAVRVGLVPAGGTGGYVLVGMAATVAATTHAPIMATVLGFELSGDYGVVLPLFLATVLATALSRRLHRESIYTAELNRRGVPWDGTLAQRLARSLRARDILERDALTVSSGSPLEPALTRLRASRARVMYVVGGPVIRAIDVGVFGRLWSWSGQAARPALVDDVAVEVVSASPDTNFLDLSDKLWNVDWGELPIVDPGRPSALAGTVSRRTLLRALDRELLQRDLLQARVAPFEGPEAGALALPRGQVVEVIGVPPSLTGQAADLCLVRRRYGVSVLGVKAPGEEGGQWCDPEGVVLPRDGRLLVIGRLEGIAELRRSA